MGDSTEYIAYEYGSLYTPPDLGHGIIDLILAPEIKIPEQDRDALLKLTAEMTVSRVLNILQGLEAGELKIVDLPTAGLGQARPVILPSGFFFEGLV